MERTGALDRRSFLMVGAGASLARPAVATTPEIEQDDVSRVVLPEVPGLDDLASASLVHAFGDHFNPPAVQNEWGYAQASKSVSGITAITFPPFACCGIPGIHHTPGFVSTCELFLDDRLLTSYPDCARRTVFIWKPHCIARETIARGIRFQTHTFLPSKRRAVAQSIVVLNGSAERRRFRLAFQMRAGVTVVRGKPWFLAVPAELSNQVDLAGDRGYVVFRALQSRAFSVQGVNPVCSETDAAGRFCYVLDLAPGESRRFHYLNVIGDDDSRELHAYGSWQHEFEKLETENREVVSRRIQAAFTPGNDRFSGHLPRLLTKDRSLWRLYYGGFTNLLVGWRDAPESAYGRTYLTLAPRFAPTATFPWDVMLTSLALSLLDPDVIRRHVEVWLSQDLHKSCAFDYTSGRGVGSSYAVNDFAVLRTAHNYLRVTGDFAWLEKTIAGQTVRDRLVDHALYWKKLDKSGRGLADYGGLDGLLEVVSTWTHEVPALNAANVYGMRFAAALVEGAGDPTRAHALRREASELSDRINRLLYVAGKGWWKCGQPDGSFHEVRHCYDFLTIVDTMGEDLSAAQKQEMARFFWSELHTPLWMHALSPSDPDATWNLRADHSWLGAYTAWPPATAKALYKIDEPARVAAWLKKLSRAARQGPFGQAHVVEHILSPDAGGARKSPTEMPYGNDWCDSSGGSFMELVIESIFGARLTSFEGIRATPHLDGFDPDSELRNLLWQGKEHRVTRNGVSSV